MGGAREAGRVSRSAERGATGAATQSRHTAVLIRMPPTARVTTWRTEVLAASTQCSAWASHPPGRSTWSARVTLEYGCLPE